MIPILITAPDKGLGFMSSWNDGAEDVYVSYMNFIQFFVTGAGGVINQCHCPTTYNLLAEKITE